MVQSCPSPTAYVLSLNLHRRNLSQGQKSAIAAESLAVFEGEAKQRQRAAGGDRQVVVEKFPPAEQGKACENIANLLGEASTAKSRPQPAPRAAREVLRI